MSRKDSLGVEVEVGDIVFSAPSHKYSGKPEVGRVSGVFDSGRVTIQIPHKVTIYAYQRGAPDVEKESYRYGPLTDENGNGIMEDYTDWRGSTHKRPVQGRIPYKYMAKDYTVVGHEWRWLRKQAADLTLIVLRKGNEKKEDIQDILAKRSGFDVLTSSLELDYDAPTPQLD